MGRVLTIANREMQSYFNGPVPYVVLGVFLFVIGYLYFSTLFLTGFASLRNFFGMAPVLLVVFAPATTMRLIAEERKTGTLEHLLSLPVTDTEVVLGKFVAAMGFLSIAFVLTLPYVFTVAHLVPSGLALDMGPVLGGYLGLVLLSASMISLGLFASALTKNQIIAFVVALLLCFFFFFIDKFAILLPLSLAPFLEYLSVDYHFGNIARGVLDLRDLLYYVSLTALGLMLTVMTMQAKKR